MRNVYDSGLSTSTYAYPAPATQSRHAVPPEEPFTPSNSSRCHQHIVPFGPSHPEKVGQPFPNPSPSATAGPSGTQEPFDDLLRRGPADRVQVPLRRCL